MSQVYFPREPEKPVKEQRRWLKRAIAGAELLLILPAALFMTAIFLRGVRPGQGEPSFTSRQIVEWYTSRPWTLWALLIAMPLAALVIGAVSLKRTWNADGELRRAVQRTLDAVRAYSPTLLVAMVTLTAAVVLVIVIVHSLVG